MNTVFYRQEDEAGRFELETIHDLNENAEEIAEQAAAEFDKGYGEFHGDIVIFLYESEDSPCFGKFVVSVDREPTYTATRRG